MTIKAEVVQTACPASGTFDITGSTPSSDMIACMSFGHAGTTNDSIAGSARFGFGCTDLSASVSLGYGIPTASTTSVGGTVSSTRMGIAWTGVGFTATNVTYSSTLSNGVRATSSNYSTGRLFNSLLLSGTGFATKVGSQVAAVAATSSVFTHGLGGTPDLIILFSNHGGTATDVRGQATSMGFWDRRSGNQCSHNYRHETSMAPDRVTAIMDSANAANYLNGDGTSSNTFQIGSVGATQFTVSFNSALTISTFIGFIAIRSTGTQLATSCGIFTTPTATGVAAAGLSVVGGRPQVVIMVPTYLTAADIIKNDDTAGGIGIGIATTNDFLSSSVGSTSFCAQDAQNPSVSGSLISTTRALNILQSDSSGSIVTATVSSWGASDISLNYSTVDGTGRKVLYLAFGEATAAAATLPIGGIIT